MDAKHIRGGGRGDAPLMKSISEAVRIDESPAVYHPKARKTFESFQNKGTLRRLNPDVTRYISEFLDHNEVLPTENERARRNASGKSRRRTRKRKTKRRKSRRARK